MFLPRGRVSFATSHPSRISFHHLLTFFRMRLLLESKIFFLCRLYNVPINITIILANITDLLGNRTNGEGRDSVESNFPLEPPPHPPQPGAGGGVVQQHGHLSPVKVVMSHQKSFLFLVFPLLFYRICLQHSPRHSSCNWQV